MVDDTVKWLEYGFTVYPPNTTWNDVGGLYIFASLSNNYWYAKYVGKAESFKSRLASSHEQWGPAQKLGATHVHAMVVPLESNRVKIEKELIEKLQPPLNVHHK
jgi:excinuclease UvrABC nuclease subunit